VNAGVAAEARILHVSPGRVRLHFPGWAPAEREALENQFRRLAGVRHVQANPWTGNVLVLFDPKAIQATTLLAACRQAKALRTLQPPAAPTSPPVKAGGIGVARLLELAKMLLQVGAFLTGLFAPSRVHLVVGGAEALLRLGRLVAARTNLAAAT
jgi:hypothetical protein